MEVNHRAGEGSRPPYDRERERREQERRQRQQDTKRQVSGGDKTLIEEAVNKFR